MNRDEIDILWQQAMTQAVKDGEMFTRHHFATLVAAAEREACAKLCDDNADCCHPGSVLHSVLGANAAAIRARSQA